MPKDLTVSDIDRQNILNNPYALEEIRKGIGITGIEYKGRMVLLKEQVAEFFEVTPRTIDNYISKHETELKRNGYEVLRGKSLKELKIAIQEMGGNEISFITKTTSLGVFDFRAFLNLREMENISYHVAAGRIDKSLLHDIIGAVLDETIDFDEELKLRLLQAIQDPL